MDTLVSEPLRTVQTARPAALAGERRDSLVVRVVIQPVRMNVAAAANRHRTAPERAGGAMDELSLATWQDAEWR